MLPSYTRSRATTGVNASVGARMELALARGAFADRQLQDRVHVAPRALADPSTEHRTVSDPNWELEFRQGLDSEAAEARSAHASETHIYQGFPASGINKPGTSPTAPVRAAATNRAMSFFAGVFTVIDAQLAGSIGAARRPAHQQLDHEKTAYLRGVSIGAPGFEPGTSPTRIMGEIRGCLAKCLQIGGFRC